MTFEGNSGIRDVGSCLESVQSWNLPKGMDRTLTDTRRSATPDSFMRRLARPADDRRRVIVKLLWLRHLAGTTDVNQLPRYDIFQAELELAHVASEFTGTGTN